MSITIYIFGQTMAVKNYKHHYKYFLRKLLLIDTGSDFNFILRSVVEELGFLAA